MPPSPLRHARLLALPALLAAAGLLATRQADLGGTPALALPPPVAGDAVALLPAAAFLPALDLPEDLAQALANRKHADAVAALQAIRPMDLPGAAVGDHAFLLAWSLVRADRAAEALPLLQVVANSRTAPEPYRLLVEGEVLLAAGQPVQAAATLGRVDRAAVIWPRARVAEARALFDAGRTADSLALYEDLAARPDPSTGSEVALWALANRAGLSSPAARPLLGRLYRHYPLSREGRLATAELGDRATAADKAWRADALMEAGAFQEATDLLAPVIGGFTEASPEACAAWYAFGRSHFKRNNATLAAEVLQPAGRRCQGVDDDRGAKALYVAGKALERKKEWVAAAQAFQQIPDLYPTHSMADDGYALAGVAWQQAGQDAAAVQQWTAQAREQAEGDLAAEGFWRLAWTAYQAGDPQAAISWAEESLWKVELQADPVHALAARYWSARWRIHPDVADPSAQNPDVEAVARGIELLEQLCREYPTSFYALLAASRLYELAPDRLAAIPRPAPPPDAGGWHVRPSWQAEPSSAWAMALARLGLVKEALAELEQHDEASLTPSEVAVRAQVMARTDPFGAHDLLHHYLLSHPAETLGPDRDRIVRLAFPDRYWDEVQQAGEGYDWDLRIFHALVREESSFNPQAKSWAGARGLSQLMPATAQHVGSKMGLRVTTAQLADPLLNLRIGSRYYDGLVSRFDGNLFLSTPAYNAGEGNLEKWLALDPDRPTDEFIEAIPLRETRHYVKRVMGTWQLYRVTYDDGPLFPDLSAFNHRARPE
ncbi:transglycosylase SLT domain-containing protein [Myxococcota bacterium]|nr:transglycosylase SLT domain-containing protein [Myxococcota bacterium]